MSHAFIDSFDDGIATELFDLSKYRYLNKCTFNWNLTFGFISIDYSCIGHLNCPLAMVFVMFSFFDTKSTDNGIDCNELFR